jgi:MFS family permease
LASGPIADRWGFNTLFAGFALISILWPLTALLVEDKVATKVQRRGASTVAQRRQLGFNFILLLMASVAAMAAFYVASLGRALTMNGLGFGAAAISGTAAFSGAVTLPLPPLIGWLSDRVERKRLLAVCYLGGLVGLLALAVAASLWQFWVASALLVVLFNANRTVGSALVTDLVPGASLGSGMSLFGATTWIGGIIGSAGAGQAVQIFGTTATFVAGGFLLLLAVPLLIPVRKARREEAIAAAAAA